MKTLRWALLTLLGTLVALTLFGLPLYGRALLERLPGGYTVRAESVGGPLWAPVLFEAQVTGPGVRVRAGELRLNVRRPNPFSKVLRFSGGLRDATVDLDLKQLLSGQRRSGWSFVPQDFSVENVRVNLDNRGYKLPNARLSVSGAGGQLRLRATTENGGAQADIRYQPGDKQLRGAADITADATLLNAYWDGVRGGKLTGHYSFDGGDLHGNLNLTGGEVVLPQNENVRVRDVTGTVIHDGDRFRLDLSGRSLGGPVTARADIDTARRVYTATVTGAPTLGDAAAALGTTGAGQLRLNARVSGWSEPEVTASLTGGGTLAGVSLRNVKATYDLNAGQSKVSLRAQTAFAGETQRVRADWTLGGAGRGMLEGRLLGAPLKLGADAQGDRVRLTGSALGGPLTGSYTLKSRALSASLNAAVRGVALRGSATGTVGDLKLKVARLAYGPVELSGTGRWGAAGGQLNLGAVALKVGENGRGTWRLNRLSAYGASASGGGQLNLKGGQLGGRLALNLPGQGRAVGPVDLSWAARRGSWNFGAGSATWSGNGGRLTLRGFEVAGFTASGDLTYADGTARGQLTASGRGGSLEARLDGTRASYAGSWRTGTWRAVGFEGRTSLAPGFASEVRVKGTDLSARLNTDNGATFQVNTGGEELKGRYQNGRLSASGRLNLAAFGQLANLPDLSGRVTLKVQNGVGSARVRATAAGATVEAGVALNRGAARLTSLSAAASGARLSLSGPLLPRADLSGTLRAYGSALAAHVSGEPTGARWSLGGETAKATLGGLTLPAQTLKLAGTLTPLRAAGSWGDLKLSFSDGQLRVNGGQRLSAFGRTGQAQVAARLGPDWAGNLDLGAELGDARLRAGGPWRGVDLVASGLGLRASGQLNVPRRSYKAKLRGEIENVLLDVSVTGTGADVRASGSARDAAGGSATFEAGPVFEAGSASDWRVNLDQLRVRGETLTGALSAEHGLVSGQVQDGNLRLSARGGRLSIEGERAGTRLSGGATLRLPATLSEVNLSAAGEWGQASLRGSGAALTGQLTLSDQVFGDVAAFPGLSVPLAASLNPLSVRAGGLGYANGSFTGALRVPYSLAGQAGSAVLRGRGTGLTATAGGPLTGKVTLWPRHKGSLSADLSPFAARLPETLRGALEAGRLRVNLDGPRATATLSGTRYLGAPVGLDAVAGWSGAWRVGGALTHAGSQLPFEVSADGLSVRGARLEAADLRPWLDGVSGELTGDLRLPGFNLERGAGEVRLDVRQGERRAGGSLTLRAGQLDADLSGALNGQAAELRGQLYPRASAKLTSGDLSGTLAGDWVAGVRVAASGVVQNKAVRLGGTVGARAVQLSGELAGARAELLARPEGGTWRGSLSVLAPDLRPLIGQSGQLSGSVEGSLQAAVGRLRGTVAGADFSAPLRWQGGALSLENAAASVAGVQLSGGGQLYPRLGLTGRAEVNAGLPGTYRWSAGGRLSEPELKASGTTRTGKAGALPTLSVPGSEVTARLLGRDWVVRAAGALSGEARGTLSGVARAEFNVDGELIWPEGRLALAGDPSWSRAAGWGGNLIASGRAYGQAARLTSRGAGALNLGGRIGAGQVSARLPADILGRPGGEVSLARFDLGALWGRGGQLSASGRAELGGSWAAPEASLTGQLEDAAGQLGGDLSGSFENGALSAALKGPVLQAGVRWTGGTYRASLTSPGLDLARLLPPAWQVTSLRFAGGARAAGNGSGLTSATLENLRLSGVQARVGPFALEGQLGYTPRELSADLKGQVLGGDVTVNGALPGGVRVAVKNLQDASLGQLNGTLTLSGAAGNPQLGGQLRLERPEVAATFDLAGQLRGPRADVRAELRGPYSGSLSGALSGVRLSPPAVNVNLSGEVARGQDKLTLDLAGAWPQLRGVAEARLAALAQPVRVSGDGTGAYQVDAGTLGNARVQLSGFLPQVSARGTLTPLDALGAGGSGALNVALTGPLSDLQLTLAGAFQDVARGGVTLEGVAVSGGGPLGSPALEVTQGGKPVGQLRAGQLSLDGLTLSAYGSRLSVTGTGNLGGGRAQVEVSGNVAGRVKLVGGPNAVSASGTLEGAGARASFDVAGSRALGWTGGGRVSAVGSTLKNVLTDDVALKLGGSWTGPSLSGSAKLLGAATALRADGQGARLTFLNGPDTGASGEFELAGGALSGEATLSRGGGRVRLDLSGSLAAPQGALNAAYGNWTATGDLTPKGGRLLISDGQSGGQLTLDGQSVRLNLPGLDLAALGLAGVRGRVQASASYQSGGGAGSGQAGSGQFAVTGAASPLRVPMLDLPLAGDLSGGASLENGQLSVLGSLSGPDGTVAVNVRRAQTWSGQLSGQLKRGGGTLSAALKLENGLANGALSAAGYPLKLAGRAVRLSGDVGIKENSFDLNGSANVPAGTLRLSGEGDLSALLSERLPGLDLGLKPASGSYQLDARAASLDLARLDVAPNLKGQLSVSASFSSPGGSSFVVASQDLKLAGEALPARVEGTADGDGWRVRGYLGNSQLFGSLAAGVLRGRVQLSAFPLGAALSAATGPLPGTGLLTGLARFEVPLADPLAGRYDLVAERLSVAAGQERLIGGGSLSYADRELTDVNVHLGGAGDWDVRGTYTRAGVDLRASFGNATFTPVLALVPALRGQGPSLQGNVLLTLGGRYERPEAKLSAPSLQGGLNGVTFALSDVSGQLAGGAWQLSGGVKLGGTLAAGGRLSAGGTFTNGQLAGVRARYAGDFASRQVGPVGEVVADLAQEGDGWTLNARAVQEGTLSVTGRLAPQLDLRVRARAFAPQIGAIFAKESVLSGDLSVTQRGEDYAVDGTLSATRLVLGRTGAPEGLTAPGSVKNPAGPGTFTSPLPPELVTFPAPSGQGAASPFLERVVFDDVPISLPNGARLDENLVRADFEGGLTLSGRASDPKLRGTVRAVRGTLFLRENEFALQRAGATWDGGSAYPDISVLASGVVPDADTPVGVDVSVRGTFGADGSGGRALSLETSFACSANCTRDGQPLTESDLYALVAFGTLGAATLPGELTQSALKTALNVFFVGEVERGLAKALGLDVLRLRTNLLSGEGGFSAQLTLGAYLTREFYLQYQVDLGGEGLLNARYTTQDGRFTFAASSPIKGLDFATLNPSFSVAYNFTPRSGVQFGVTSGRSGSTFKLGYSLRY